MKRKDNYLSMMSFVLIACALLSYVIPLLRWIVPLIAIGCSLYIYFCADYFSATERNSSHWRTYRYLALLGMTVCVCLYILTYIRQGSMKESSGDLIIIVFITAFGNLAPKIPFNRTLGLRLPWTVSHENTWKYAHIIVGYCTFPSVFLLFLGYYFAYPILYFAGMIIWVLIPSYLSYQYDKKHNSKECSAEEVETTSSLLDAKEDFLDRIKVKLYDVKFLLNIAYSICIIMSIALYPFLPAELPMQFASDGSVNWTLPKLLGILMIPSIAFMIMHYYKGLKRLDYRSVFTIILLITFDIGFLIYIAFFS